MSLKPTLPHPPPSDEEEATTIRKLATYVARNGDAFEEKVRLKEAENPKFSFLKADQNETGHNFYQWTLFLAKHFYTQDQIIAIETQFVDRLNSVPPGSIELTADDSTALMTLLRENTGSKESIKSLRRWILDRAHSIVAIAQAICNHARAIFFTGASPSSYSAALHTVYVINDVLFNGANATTEGPYTKLLQQPQPVNIIASLLPYLSFILRSSYACTTADAERERLLKMTTIWVSKGFIDEGFGSFLSSSMVQVQLANEDPPQFPLATPYPTNLPLPNMPPQSAQPPVMQHLQQPQPQMIFDPMSGTMRPQFPVAPAMQLHVGLPQSGMMMGMQPMQAMQQFSGGMQPLFVQQTQPPMMGLPPTGLAPFPQTNNLPGLSVPMFSMPAVPAPQITTPTLDLNKSSVGTMANVLKTVIKSGHPRYAPIDISIVSQAVPPYVEPGRLEARVAEFYRKLQPIVSQGAGDPAATVIAGPGGFGALPPSGAIGGPAGDPALWSTSGRSLPLPPGLDNSIGGASGGYLAPPPTFTFPAASAAAAPIGEENIGHSLLKGFGWQEGSGLGADGSGRVDIIKEAGNKGKMGVGAGADPASIAGDFSVYRQQQSETYHTKLVDRDRH